MTRGKYAARAARRREDADVRSEIASYQDTVRRLTADNDALRQALGKAKAAHRDEVRALRTQRDEGLSPHVAAMEDEMNRLRDKADRAVADKQRTVKTHEKLVFDFITILSSHLGITRAKAMDLLVSEGAGERAIVGFNVRHSIKDLDRRHMARIEQARRGTTS